MKYLRSKKGTIDGYKVERHLGHGAFACVKEVSKDGNRYAMKIFKFQPNEKD